MVHYYYPLTLPIPFEGQHNIFLSSISLIQEITERLETVIDMVFVLV